MNRFVGHVVRDRFFYYSDSMPARRTQFPRVTAFAEGYISNFLELSREAISRGEVLGKEIPSRFISAYLWWGKDLTRHVVGQFSGAIVDHDLKSVLLFQDSLGIHQMFYSLSGMSISFGNELMDLAKLLRPEQLEVRYFAEMFGKGLPNTRLTPYREVFRLKHGSVLSWQNGTIQSVQPWVPSHVHMRPNLSAQDYEAELRHRLEVAVDSAIPSDKAAWCELSGGLDSTSVLSIALTLGKRVEPFSFVNDLDKDDGDTLVAGQVVSQLDLSWHSLSASSSRPFSSIPNDFRAEPGTEIYCARQKQYRELLLANQVEIVLTGVGGDITFGSTDCQPFHLADSLYQGKLLQLVDDLLKWQRSDPQYRSVLFWLWEYSIKTAAKHFIGRRASRPGITNMLPNWLSAKFVDDYDLKRLSRVQDTPRHSEPGRHALWEEVYLQSSSVGVGAVRYPDTEFRHPLLDRPLVEFMLSIPYEQRMRADEDRYLQRRALRRVLPEVVLTRRNKGSGQYSFDSGFSRSEEWFLSLTRTPRLHSMGIVDLPKWRLEVSKARFGLYESLPHFALAASVECWLRRFENGLPELDYEMVEEKEWACQ